MVVRATDPYWYDTADIVNTYVSGGTPPAFFPFFPLRLSSSSVFASPVVVNDGDVEAWPVWTIVGPGSAIVLRNLTVGSVLSLPVTLGVDEAVTIDTRPGVKTVRNSSGLSLFGSLTWDSALAALVKGPNTLALEMSGATPASSIMLSYRRRFLTC